MGRGKIEIKRIENTNNRHVTYSKRRKGMMKKAREITVLCDAKLALIIFASSGKMHEYCSPSTNLAEMLGTYQQILGKRLWDEKHESLSNEMDRIKKDNDNLQIELRRLKGEDIQSMNYKDLIAIESVLETGLVHVRNRQMECLRELKRREKMIEEENRQLNFRLQQEMAIASNARQMENGFPQGAGAMKDCEADDIPFAFRVQPIQPNLQHIV
ncbi:PREDICTED: floral homeotic protein PISTILLATA-like isoform X2 [Tarenaya hassleriana]|uniref:floral homeotic protein PISTILLATA-like isoform X2 n=1 Tax=Tarenaya hassleriana TaxID=28532 RepID=UPI00053C646D|nr:PREDICTED: floral homeotic protein PISTILLATA-like isoform X2 [Tarenaya hassleriana]